MGDTDDIKTRNLLGQKRHRCGPNWDKNDMYTGAIGTKMTSKTIKNRLIGTSMT
jgi:hypothetical protein